MRAESVDHSRRINVGYSKTLRDGEFANNPSGLAVGGFDKTICTSGIQLTAVNAVGDIATATLVSPGAPCGLNHICAIAASSSCRVLWYSIFVQRWQLQCRDMAAAETDGDQWLGGMHCLGEQLPRQRQ